MSLTEKICFAVTHYGIFEMQLVVNTVECEDGECGRSVEY